MSGVHTNSIGNKQYLKSSCHHTSSVSQYVSLHVYWQARVELRRLRYIKQATWAAGVINRWFYGWKARKQVREMKYRLRVEKSVVTIQAYYRGWKV